MTEIYALIPARAGSSRLPGKNALPFHGRPLYEWTTEFALRSQIFDRIFVSSDIEEFKSHALAQEMEIIERPSRLAGADATLLELIQYSIREIGLKRDALLVLLPVTGPLRVRNDLEDGIRLFFESGASRTVIPVSQNLHPPALLWEMDDGELIPKEKSDDPKFTQKHKHKSTYLWNDLFLLDSCENWLDPTRNLYGEKPLGLEIPLERCMPIDYPIQFRLCQTLFPPIDERTGKEEWRT